MIARCFPLVGRLAILVTLSPCHLVTLSSAQPRKDERNKAVDEAIAKALEFLQAGQNQDGTWSAGRGGSTAAITGLSVMAFLSAGHVPGEGVYGKTVEKGIRAVLRMQHPNGLIAGDGRHEMYHHGICTLMLAEVAGMTQGPLANEIRQKLEKAVNIILLAQRRGQFPDDPNRGGWRYQVAGDDADMSVTGWQLLALRAAKNLGCDVPPQAIDRAVDYIKRSQDGQGAFCYTPGGRGPTIPCTGTGILGLAVCGKEHHRSPEAIRGGKFLMKYPPRWGQGHFFYMIYYCSQATFQLGGNYWEFYRPHLHDVLLKNQKPTGSWYGSDNYGPYYATSMAVLALAVEYRFLPIYQRGEEPSDRK
jgi:Prenyltransferase and squalene oxidase repeat